MDFSINTMIFLLSLFFINQFIYANNETTKNTKAFSILIDPGHGGSDSGAIRNNTIEAEITYNWSIKLHNLFYESYSSNNISSWLTRQSNQTFSLQNRIDLIQKNKPDLFLSLHANTSNIKSHKGIEIYISTDDVINSFNFFKNQNTNQLNNFEYELLHKTSRFGQILKSYRLAQILKNELYNAHVVIKRAPYYVIQKSYTPSILLELGFISNLEESALLSSPSYQDIHLKKIHNAILSYKKETDDNVFTLE